MTKFCETHVVERSLPELRARRRELEARDLSEKPGLQRELERIRDRESYLQNSHAVREAQNPPQYARVGICVVCQLRETDASDVICVECREESRATVGPPTEELDGRPIDLPADPEDAPILKAVIEEFERRYKEEPERLASFDAISIDYENDVKPSDAYKLGVADCIAYFRQLANGSTFEVLVVEPVYADDEEQTDGE